MNGSLKYKQNCKIDHVGFCIGVMCSFCNRLYVSFKKTQFSFFPSVSCKMLLKTFDNKPQLNWKKYFLPQNPSVKSLDKSVKKKEKR
jgi:hypothetical protein